MNERRLFVSEAILLLAVLIPLGLAETVYWLPSVSVMGIFVGWRRTIRQDRPLLGPVSGPAVVVLCFGFLVVEYFVLRFIPVMALAHFMGLVCTSKFLVRRNYRDHGQVFVLLLLLLVVAAIVSGNLLFPAALTVFLTVGIYVLMHFHLGLEAARVEERNKQIVAASLTPAIAPIPAYISFTKPTIAVAAFSVAAGVAIFISIPRIGAGILGHWENPAGASALTGMSASLKFNSIGPIQESQQQIMRVQIESRDLETLSNGPGPYFRGWVLSQYRSNSNPIPTWEWVRATHASSASSSRTYVSLRPELDGSIAVLPSARLPDERIITQRYWLEPTDSFALFTCYPPLDLYFESTSPDEIKKCVEDQVLHMERRGRRLLRYTVRSARVATRSIAEALKSERVRERASEPEVSLEELPRAAEMRDLIERLKSGIDSLDSPANRLALAHRFEDYFHSGEFKYTLNPPPTRPGVEPIGEFLLTRRRGHCEYFAAAMAVLCQMSGVPARVVCGYCGGDYNAVGHFFIVRQKHAHAWVEVFIPGLDWVTFDPTPVRTADLADKSRRTFLGLSKYLDYFQFLWANLVVSYDADLRRTLFTRFSAWLLRPVQDERTIIGAVAAFVRELFGWRLELNWRERFIYWLFALLVVTLIALVGYVLYRAIAWLWPRLRRVWGDRTEQTGSIKTEFYRRFCRQLRSWGIVRRPGQTPAEFAQELAGRLPICARATRLVQAYYRVAFGGADLSALEESEIEGFLKTLAKADPAQIRTQLASLGSF